MTPRSTWRLLTNNLPGAGRADIAAVGDNAITGILLHTRAIIGTPKWT